MQLVHVDVQQRAAARLGVAGSEFPNVGLERAAGMQTGREVEAPRQQRRHLAAEVLAQVEVPALEVALFDGAQEHQHARYLAAAAEHGHRDDLERHAFAGTVGQLVDHDDALLLERGVQQARAQAREQPMRVAVGGVAGMDDQVDLAVGHQHRAERAPHALNGRAQHAGQDGIVVRTAPLIGREVDEPFELARTVRKRRVLAVTPLVAGRTSGDARAGGGRARTAASLDQAAPEQVHHRAEHLPHLVAGRGGLVFAGAARDHHRAGADRLLVDDRRQHVGRQRTAQRHGDHAARDTTRQNPHDGGLQRRRRRRAAGPEDGGRRIEKRHSARAREHGDGDVGIVREQFPVDGMGALCHGAIMFQSSGR